MNGAGVIERHGNREGSRTRIVCECRIIGKQSSSALRIVDALAIPGHERAVVDERRAGKHVEVLIADKCRRLVRGVGERITVKLKFQRPLLLASMLTPPAGKVMVDPAKVPGPLKVRAELKVDVPVRTPLFKSTLSTAAEGGKPRRGRIRSR